VLPIPRKNLEAYRRMSRRAGRIWRQHGALEYVEAVGDDLNIKGVTPFPKRIRTRPGETIVFSYIVYRSRAHRDRVNKKVMKDPRMGTSMSGEMPFDVKRMLYGGFNVIVDV
jgi:uncharacterized protein YbaA (DUF1428 family)